ncbi:hypothetical protein Slin14017_G119920 [Septoria linicola]|nr:hypothetical protein Slin14017_G119920 [Septoria linicola]
MAKLKLSDEGCGGEGEDETPGIIILNPGQLLYSHDMGKNVSMPTWQSRPRPTAISECYKIEPRYNFIPGHENPHKHVQTVFNHILPKLIPSNARLHIITIGDGAEPTIDLLNQTLLKNANLKLQAGMLESIALIDPTHDHDSITSDLLRAFLATKGKSWVQSEETKGTRLLMPEGALLGMPALEYAPNARAVLSELEGALVTDSSDEVASAQDSNVVESDSNEHEDSAAAGADDDRSPTPVPPNTPAALLPSSPEPTFTPQTVTLPQPQPDQEVSAPNNNENEFDEEEDEYPPPPPLPVSCPTYSAGVCDGVVETVFPAVMDDVLEHLWTRIKLARDQEKSAAAREEARGVAWPRDGDEE